MQDYYITYSEFAFPVFLCIKLHNCVIIIFVFIEFVVLAEKKKKQHEES